jgi:nitrogenase iron protein NifH
MESIVFFGKGGIGKSTIASNMSVILACGGRKVLHVGCDPKMDCCLSLMRKHIPPFADTSGEGTEAALRKSIHPAAVKGVHCIEAGGPQPGVGCAGTGIGTMLDAMKDSSLMEKDGYDVAVFDVLGDVVCGGFAAPLRRGFAKKAVIVTSEEVLSLYAASKLMMMISNYARNGVYLAGLVVNAKNPAGVRVAEDFARAAGTRILGVILRDPAVAAAEREHRPAALAYPKSDFARRAVRLCSAIGTAVAPEIPPRALSDMDFFAFAEGKEAQKPYAPASQPAKGKTKGGGRGRRSAVSLFDAAGFKPSGMEGGQIICDWKSSKGVFKTIIAPASVAHEGMPRFSDWAVCFHPSVAKDRGASNTELMDAAARLAPLRFDEMLSTFTGMKDFYGGLVAFGGPEDKTLAAPDTPRRPHMGFGQWQRFIFPRGAVNSCIPPGSVMVEHGDSECRFSGCTGGALGLFSENAGLESSGRQFRGPFLPKSEHFIVNTEFQSRDAIFGDEAKMLDSLSRAADQAGPGGLVEFYVGCSPLLLSSDVRAFAHRVEREKGVKVVIENYNSFYEHSPAKSAVRVDFMAASLSRGKAVKTRDVNLIGFGESAERLTALLAEMGISAGEPGSDFYGAARASRLQVLSTPDSVLGPAFDKAKMKWLLPPPPYGFAGAAAWLAAVAGALGRKKAVTGPSAAQKEAALQLWRRSRGYAVGFILAAEEINLLSGSSALRMVPVLPVLVEAGFGIRLFVSGESFYKKTAADISALKAALPEMRLSVKFFETKKELAALLRGDPVLRLVYSDVRNDPRVVSAGKNPFSAALFEPGYEGALESRRRLAELCEWDFNERHLASK